MTLRARSSSVPTTMRSGCLKSWMAAPSRRNSGFETGDVAIRPQLADDALDLVAGADRDGRFGDDNGEIAQRGGNLAGGGVDVGQIGMAVTAAA